MQLSLSAELGCYLQHFLELIVFGFGRCSQRDLNISPDMAIQRILRRWS